MQRKILAGLLMGMLSSTLSAVPPQTLSTPKIADGTWYFGAQLGAGFVSDDSAYGKGGVFFQDGDFTTKLGPNLAYNLHAGYLWRIADKWDLGWQIAYQNLGYSQDTFKIIDDQGVTTTIHNKLHGQNVLLALMAQYHINNNWALYSTLGGGYVTRYGDGRFIDESSNEEVKIPHGNLSTYKLLWGMGLSYQLSQALDLTTSYQHIFGDHSNTSPTMDSFWLGLGYSLQPLTWQDFNHYTENHQGWHVGAVLGQASTSRSAQLQRLADQIILFANHKFQTQSGLGGVNVGYQWAVTPDWNWGWQFGANFIGDTTTSYNALPIEGLDTAIAKTKVQNQQVYDLLLGGNYFVTSNWYVSGKAGLALHDYTIKTEEAPLYPGAPELPVGKYNYQVFSPEYQLGLGYMFANGLDMNLLYDNILGSGQDSNPTVGSFLLGVNYNLFNTLQQKKPIGRHPAGWSIGAALGLSEIQTGFSAATQHGGGTLQQQSQAQSISYEQYTKPGKAISAELHAQYKWQTGARWFTGLQFGYRNVGLDTFVSKNFTNAGALTSSTAVKTNAQLVDILAKEQYWLSPSVDIFTGLGAAVTRFDYATSSYGQSVAPTRFRETRYNLSPQWQIGLGYQLSKDLNMNVLVDHVMGNDSTYNPTLNSILVGLDYSMAPSFGINKSIQPVSNKHWIVQVDAGLGRIYTNASGRTFDLETMKHKADIMGLVSGAGFGYQWAAGERTLLGLVLAYHNYGRSSSQITSDEEGVGSLIKDSTGVQTISLLSTLRYNLTGRWQLLGKLGFADKIVRYKMMADYFGGFDPEPSEHSVRYFNSLSPEIALGVGHNITVNSGLDILFDTVFGQGATDFNVLKSTSTFTADKNPTIGSVTLGYHYDF